MCFQGQEAPNLKATKQAAQLQGGRAPPEPTPEPRRESLSRHRKVDVRLPKKKIKPPWREASLPKHLDYRVDADQ